MRAEEWTAGHALDAEICRVVFVHEANFDRHPSFIQNMHAHWRDGEAWVCVLPYSTDIGAAWTVLETVGGIVWLERDSEGWYCHVSARLGRFDDPDIHWMTGPGAQAETAPLAICRAALSALARPSGTAGEGEA